MECQARLAPHINYQYEECELKLRRVEEEQLRVLSEARALRSCDFYSWAKKVAHTMLSSRLQQSLIVALSSWMRVTKDEHHHRELEELRARLSQVELQAQGAERMAAMGPQGAHLDQGVLSQEATGAAAALEGASPTSASRRSSTAAV